MKLFEFKPKLVSCLKNYSKETFMADLMAGIIVGIVALPLAIAFGIASGVSPEKGIITAIIAGFIISLLGGSKVQIGGPTGAFIVIIYGIIQQYGEAGLIVATLMEYSSSEQLSSSSLILSSSDLPAVSLSLFSRPKSPIFSVYLSETRKCRETSSGSG